MTMSNNTQLGLFSTTYALTSLLQAGSALSAGKMAKRQSSLEGKQIRLNALSREVDRKESLAKALATANASSGTKGIAAFEGSPLAILEQMETNVADESERDKYMTNLASTTAKYKGKQAKAGYQSQAAMSILSNAGSYVGNL